MLMGMSMGDVLSLFLLHVFSCLSLHLGLFDRVFAQHSILL